MKFVIDIGPDWISRLSNAAHVAIHWSSVGPDDECDERIMSWARDNDHVVLTADLDFGTRLVRSGEDGPSVVQIRTPITLASRVGSVVLAAVEQSAAGLTAGALVTIESERFRVRLLSSFLKS